MRSLPAIPPGAKRRRSLGHVPRPQGPRYAVPPPGQVLRDAVPVGPPPWRARTPHGAPPGRCGPARARPLPPGADLLASTRHAPAPRRPSGPRQPAYGRPRRWSSRLALRRYTTCTTSIPCRQENDRRMGILRGNGDPGPLARPFARGLKDLGHTVEDCLDVLPVDTVVGGEAEAATRPPGGADQNPPFLQGCYELRGRDALAHHVGEEDVRLYLVTVHYQRREAAHAFGQAAGVGVVLGELGRRVVERIEAGRGDDTRLAHRAAQQLAGDAGALNEGGWADQQGADGGGKPLRDAEHDRVDVGGDRGHRQAEIDAGVEDAGAVHVDREVMASRDVRDR